MPIARTARYRFGQILLAWIPDRHGNVKERPVVIIDVDADYARDNDILVVAISTRRDS
jgi:hypothetical protein